MRYTKEENNIIKKIKRSANLSRGMGFTVNILLFVVFILFLFPVIWILIMSLKTQNQIAMMPPDIFSSFTLENYKNLFQIGVEQGGTITEQTAQTLTQIKTAGFLNGLMNTLIISVTSVLIATLVGVPAAYGLSRYRSPGKESTAFIFLSFRFVPELVILIPLYIIYQKVNLYGTYWGLIWVYILISLPMIIWITRSYIDDLPFDLEQAAMLDHYSKLRAFFKIILPLAKPGIAAAIILSFIFTWNNFIFGFILSTNRLQPITVAIIRYLDITDLNYGTMAAAIMISIIPMIIVSQIASRYLVSGLSLGAIKQ